MIRFYSPIFLLQLFCLYHAYANDREQKWFWIILFFPFIGSLFYLYDTFYSRQNMEDLAEEVKSTFISNYKIKELEKQLKFSETTVNKMNLADEYFKVEYYKGALDLYESCLTGNHDADINLLKKIITTSYRMEEYEVVVQYGELLKDNREFKNAAEKSALAWAYFELEQYEKAEAVFQGIDVRFSNYELRLEYAKFLEITGHIEEGKDKLEELLEELESMDRKERRQKKSIYGQVRALYARLSEEA
ncbi:MAG: hypothetical protein AAGG75_14420 [Bacteroidota bacterium]